jgi:hypothetical protein
LQKFPPIYGKIHEVGFEVGLTPPHICHITNIALVAAATAVAAILNAVPPLHRRCHLQHCAAAALPPPSPTLCRRCAATIAVLPPLPLPRCCRRHVAALPAVAALPPPPARCHRQCCTAANTAVTIAFVFIVVVVAIIVAVSVTIAAAAFS